MTGTSESSLVVSKPRGRSSERRLASFVHSSHRGSGWKSDLQDNIDALQAEMKREEVRKESKRIFNKLDSDGSKTASKDEIYKFVAKNEELWEKLRRKLNQPKDKAIMAATRVAMELATGLEGQAALDAELTKEQFHEFRKKYMLDSKGTDEFFQRAIFANFDADHSGALDEEELDEFLTAIYDTRDVRKKRYSMWDQGQMKDLILEKFDKDGDNAVSYSDVKDIIGGGAKSLNKLKRQKEVEVELNIQTPGAKTRVSDSSISSKGMEEVLFTMDAADTQTAGSATSENWRQRAEEVAAEKEEFDFCDWLERKVTRAPPGGAKRGFCRNVGCVIS